MEVDRTPDERTKSAQPFIYRRFRLGFAVIVSLFFLWAIANNFNDILIRHFQKGLGLNRAEAGLLQFVFYIGYFVVALPAGLLMRRAGYRAGILVGLGLYAGGAMLFYPASMTLNYGFFLCALFVLAAGAACLETSANAYIGTFGDPATAVQRLNFAQAFNGLGGFLAPIAGGLLIFSGIEHSAGALAAMTPSELAAYRADELANVRLPYMLIAAAAILTGVAVFFARLPDAAAEGGKQAKAGLADALRHRPLRLAVVAQFFYVGAQVGIWSYFIDFVKDTMPQVPERQAAYLLSVSLVLFMAGRFLGTAMMARIRPAHLLTFNAFVNVALCAVAALAGGWVAIGALAMTSLFMSIMFPTIFALGVEGLGEARPMGSSCIIMAIIGGAVFPPLMGLAALWTGSMSPALFLPLLCFVVIGLYARAVTSGAKIDVPAALAQ